MRYILVCGLHCDIWEHSETQLMFILRVGTDEVDWLILVYLTFLSYNMMNVIYRKYVYNNVKFYGHRIFQPFYHMSGTRSSFTVA